MNITRTALAKTLNVIGATLVGLYFLRALAVNPLGAIALAAAVVGLYLFFRSKER